ncbi:hypothetical protein OSTOST_06290, partial [Ostertagia ostertagi]
VSTEDGVADLISLVEGERCLWDTSTEDYRNIYRKEEAWNRIYMYKVLRDNYRRNAVYKIGVNSKKPWFFAKYMRFLDKVDVQGSGTLPISDTSQTGQWELVDSASTSSPETEKFRGRKRIATEGEESKGVQGPSNPAKKKTDEPEPRDKFSHFGNFVAAHLRALPEEISSDKIENLTTVLLYNVLVTKIKDETAFEGS